MSKITIKRWIDLTCMTVIAILVCIILTPSLFSISNILTNILIPWSIWIQYSIVGLLAGFLWLIIIRLGGFRLSDCKSLLLFRHPPVWFFGLIGACFYLWLLKDGIKDQSNISIFSDKISLAAYTGSVLLGFSAAIFLNSSFFSWQDKISDENRGKSDKYVNFQSIIENPIQLIDWIQEESPINNPSEDLFGLNVTAKRIAGILLNTDLKTIGVVGPYGCGKSSLLNLVEYYLQNQNKIIQLSSNKNNSGGQEKTLFSGNFLIARIDGWGRIEGSIAQQILSVAVNVVSKKVDCLSLITLPAKYRAALAGTSSSFATIIAALLKTVSGNAIMYQKWE